MSRGEGRRAIELFTVESASSFFIYDDGKKAFVRVWISD